MGTHSTDNKKEIIFIPGDPVSWEEIEKQLIASRLMSYELERSQLRTGTHVGSSKGKLWSDLRIRELNYKINALRHRQLD